jgi:hypothetical protein
MQNAEGFNLHFKIENMHDVITPLALFLFWNRNKEEEGDI